MPMKPLRAALYVLDTVVIALVLCLPALWLMGRIKFEAVGFSMSWGLRPFVTLAVLFVLRGVVASRLRGRGAACAAWLGRVWVKKSLLSLGVLILALPVLDQVLAAKGYERNALPIVIQGAENWTDTDPRFEDDPHMLWRFKPGTSIHGQSINALGFPEREISPEKRTRTRRIICLGDSCTADGVPPYSTILHGLLTNAPPSSESWEAFHNGVHGYSILQGLELFRRTTQRLQPDVVTIYFGWNAHWKGEQTDAEQFKTRAASPMMNALRRLYSSASRDGEDRPLRVPPESYESALKTLIREVRGSGALPIVITAPRARRLASAVAERQGASLDDVHALHDRYVELTRSVAAAEKVLIVDAARLAEEYPTHGDFFRADGIHLRLAGRKMMAELIYKTVTNAVNIGRRGSQNLREILPPAHEVWGDSGG